MHCCIFSSNISLLTLKHICLGIQETSRYTALYFYVLLYILYCYDCFIISSPICSHNMFSSGRILIHLSMLETPQKVQALFSHFLIQLLLLLLLLSRFSPVRLCATPQMQPTRLPSSWDSPGKNTGVAAISFSNA